MYIIETARLGLRDWQESDLSPYAAMCNDPRVMEFFPKTLTKEEAREMINRLKQHIAAKGYGFWAVDIKTTGEFIGFVGLETPRFEADFTPCVEIGWRLAYQYWNKGYAQEAARKCLEFGFNHLGLTEIVAFTPILNKRSINVMKKIGMTYVKDFDHPNIKLGSPLRKHVLYKIASKHCSMVIF